MVRSASVPVDVEWLPAKALGDAIAEREANQRGCCFGHNRMLCESQVVGFYDQGNEFGRALQQWRGFTRNCTISSWHACLCSSDNQMWCSLHTN